MKFLLGQSIGLLATGVYGSAMVGVEHQHTSRQDASTVSVNLASTQGPPEHLASGFIYGIPDTPNQVPASFYTNMGFRYTRAGGSQLPAPARGWVYGQTEFQNRFNSALSNYQTARQYGANMILLVSDIWGADGTQGIAMPGDNGNWTSYDDFLSSIISNIDSNNMLPGLDYEIWNEPDLGTVFWQRNMSQYLDMWGRGYHRIKSTFPNLPIIGPCISGAPSSSNSWITQFYSFVKSNNSIPDIYCWHVERTGDDLSVEVANQRALESQYGLPANPIILNEYGLPDEQQPAGAAWFISRLERANVIGLRGNWLSSYSLHDYFASLLGKPGANGDEDQSDGQVAGYWPNGEYQVYQYYNLNMTGQRIATTGSGDAEFDCYATSGGTIFTVKILCGSRLTNGDYNIQVSDLQSLGAPSSGSITIQTYHFDYTGGAFGNVQAPEDQGKSTHYYSDNSLTFGVTAQNTTAYAFEFVSY